MTIAFLGDSITLGYGLENKDSLTGLNLDDSNLEMLNSTVGLTEDEFANVESGKGYVANDVPRNAKSGQSIDMLPIDATFMPIKRVSYEVENTRVGDSIDYDKLTLEIWSNGCIDVTTALTQAADLLIEHFVQIAAITGKTTVISTVDSVSEPEVAEVVAKLLTEIQARYIDKDNVRDMIDAAI